MSKATVIIDGFLGRDPEIRITPKGDTVATLAVAVTERRKVNDQYEDGETTWFRVNHWGKDGEAIVETARKGDRVIIIGQVKLSTYEKDGQTKATVDVRAKTVSLIPKPLAKTTTTLDGAAPW